MSGWNPLLKKPYLCSKPLLTQGLASHSDERQLEYIYRELTEFEDHSKKLYKEVKRYEDCISVLHKLEVKMTSDLCNSPACHEDQKLRKMAEDYQSVVYQMGHATGDLTTLSQKTVVEPMKKITGEFGAIAAAIKKRDTVLTECLKYQQKMEKLSKQEKTGNNIVKLEQTKTQFQNAKDEFNTLNRLLLMELPQFYEKRIDYFQPCLQALIRTQVDYYGESTKLFTHLVSTSTSSLSCSDQVFQQQFDKQIADIKALSIVDQV